MFLRRLRIAVSVFFALVAVAFALLWVRSYSRVDLVTRAASGGGFQVAVSSIGGRLSFEAFSPPVDGAGWYVRSDPNPDPNAKRRPFGMEWDNSQTYYGVTSPHWLFVAIAAACVALPWVRRRYSVRALLIATTLLAVVLGLAVWAGR